MKKHIRKQSIITAALFAATIAYAQQSFQPSSPTDSPTVDINSNQPDPAISNSAVYGLYSMNYGLTNGIDSAINITASAQGASMPATGVYFRYLEGTSDASMKQLGTLAANISVSSDFYATGMMLDSIAMANGSEISSKITVRAGNSVTGLWVTDTPGTSSDPHYVFSGTIDAATTTNTDSYNYGITLSQRRERTFELKNSSIYVSGSRAYAFFSDRAVESLVMTGNNRLEASGTTGSVYAICTPGTTNIYADAGGTQTFIGGVYALATAGEGVSFKTGNFVMDANGAYTTIVAPVINIDDGVKIDFLKTVYLMSAASMKSAVLIDGQLTIHASSVSDFGSIYTQDADITLGSNALLTLILADDFSYDLGDIMILVAHAKVSDTIDGSFADNFVVKYENGAILDSDNYFFDGYKLTFVPEPSSYAVVLCGMAVVFAAFRRKE